MAKKPPPPKFRPAEPALESAGETQVSGPLATIEAPIGQPTSLAIALQRAEVDQQVSTAHVYPRRLRGDIKAHIRDAVTDDDETAEECVYALPRGGKAIRGPSIRFAEIVASEFGNCRVGSRVLHVDRFEKWVEAEGVFHDLETGLVTSNRHRRPIQDRNGRIYNDDMINVTGNAAAAVALRNAIIRGVPKRFWRGAYLAAESVIAGDIKTLGERRDAAVKTFAAWGVTPERVLAALEVRSIEDIGSEELVQLTAMRTAIKSREQTVEELFPEKKPDPGPAPKGLGDKLDALSGAPKPPSGEPGETLKFPEWPNRPQQEETSGERNDDDPRTD